MALLERLDRRLSRLEAAVERIEAAERTLPNAIATVTDTFDDLADRLHERGIDIDRRLSVLLDVAERLTSPVALDALNALVTACSEPPRQVGLWGATRAMSDDDVKRAVGFLVRMAQAFGRSLAEPQPPELEGGGRA